jgi:hypothetical protein
MSEKVIRLTMMELWRGIQEAKRLFPVGTEWLHTGSGDVYEITSHGVDEETGQPEVCYVRARPLEDSRVDYRRICVGDFPQDYAREVQFHRLLSVMRTPGKFERVYRTETFQAKSGKELTNVR